MQKICIIGGGAMGTALLSGILTAALLAPENIYLVESDSQKAATLQTKFGINSCAKLKEAAETCETIILAVKPGVLLEVLKELASFLEKRHLVISIAAGISMAALEAAGAKARFMRVMPNTPTQIGQGISAYCLGKNVKPEDEAQLQTIFGSMGQVVQVTEEQMDVVTSLSGSGPAYVYYFTEALIDAGVLLGLTREVATQLAVATLSGSAELLKESGAHPVVLRNQVTSPAGTTAAALFELEKGAFSGLIGKALLAATQRSKEISRIYQGNK